MVTIYHNTKCSKSRATLNILEEKNLEFEVIDYLKTPPAKDELINILQKLGISAKDFIRSGERVFKELALENCNEMELIDAMINNPILIERPIVKTKKGVVIGRPPENILKII